jgi:hypothetical protein
MGAQENSPDKEISPMGQAELRNSTAYKAFGLAFGLFCVWFLFSLTQLGHHVEAAIGKTFPAQFVAVNLALLPCLIALTAGAWRIPLFLRFSFGLVMFCSIVMFEVSFRRFLLGSCGVLAIVLVEAYWVIPRSNARHRRNDALS